MAEPTPRLEVGTHLFIYLALYFVGGMVGIGIGFVILDVLALILQEVPPMAILVSFLVPFLAGVYIPRLHFARSFPAKCPTCGGPAYIRWPSRHITYICRPSGHEYSTSLRLGGR